MTPETAQPVTTEYFQTAMAALDVQPPVAVAVSGGADSMALLLLCRDWLRRSS
ncbi:MAG TPA: tRNA(Ile)-lysidine synthetase, partial [Alphaproteobacteria bacterium]|nr:tRNA(Ile)-lysidine synthetase [Alphaproteobacteria bacterium]